ncbi:MAG: ATP-binding protein [Bacilli bacterium]|jgi:hypothetical protein|nr:ATP-binding protein [Bacilli bacterium]
MELKLPIGIENYKDVAKDCYYVDKTMLIKELLDLPLGSAVLFTRPRRFGKSLALSMLKTFFEQGENNESYFENKAISRAGERYLSQLGSSPVIRITMKDVRGTSFNELLRRCKDVISAEYSRYANIVSGNVLTEQEKNYFQSIVDGGADAVAFSSSLVKLSHFLYNFYGKRVVVLLDEYDTPIESARENGFYENAITFFQPFYSQALKGNDSLRLAAITGVLQVAKESLFSGLNNLLVNSITGHGFDGYFGFTEEETASLLKYYGKDTEFTKVGDWYGGYRFGDETIYNPWSILSFARSGVFEPYWTNTGENSVLGELLAEADGNTLNSLSDIFSGGEAFAVIDTSISYRALSASKDVLLSFLAATGYLSASERIDGSVFKVRIPNKEVGETFESEIKNRFIPADKMDSFYRLRDAFMSGKPSRLSKSIEDILLSAFSSFDFSDEKNYQILVLAISALLFGDCVVKSEQTAGSGRCDILILPKTKNHFGAVIEIKYFRSKTSTPRLEAESKKAVNQIKAMDYVEELRQREDYPVFAHGIVFFKKKAVVSFEELTHKEEAD